MGVVLGGMNLGFIVASLGVLAECRFYFGGRPPKSPRNRPTRRSNLRAVLMGAGDGAVLRLSTDPSDPRPIKLKLMTSPVALQPWFADSNYRRRRIWPLSKIAPFHEVGATSPPQTSPTERSAGLPPRCIRSPAGPQARSGDPGSKRRAGTAGKAASASDRSEG
jgi:hypothetical protein